MPEGLYHWEGKRRLADPLVTKKRRLPDRTDVAAQLALDIRCWLAPTDDAVMRGALAGPVLRHLARRLPEPTAWDHDDLRAKLVWDFVVERVVTIHDHHDHDYWQFPEETLHLRSGDCEDKSFLAASLLGAAGILPERIRVVMGAVVKSRQKNPRRIIGHAWPIYRDSSGRWCALEPNLNHLPVADANGRLVVPTRAADLRRVEFLPMDDCAADGRDSQYVPLICLNWHGVWSVEETRRGRVKTAGEIQPDWSQPLKFRDIWRRCRRLLTHDDDSSVDG